MVSSELIAQARANGSDKSYLEWIKRQPSAYSGQFDWIDGEGYCDPSHVRRAGEAGTAYKPEYSAIPLTHAEHLLTHTRGESALASKEWFEEMAEEYLRKWIESK